MKNNILPQTGLKGLKENWQSDILAGFLVFLLALPLSLGIAKASGFPASMGVLTAMIGGLFVSLFKVSPLTIKGPAAGLITVCAGAIIEFGGGDQGWHMACGVIVIVALIQILFGFLKFGSLSDFFPHSAVHGMLAAIGLIIIAKQVPVLLGDAPEMYKGLGPIILFEDIPWFVEKLNPQIALIGGISLLNLFLMPLIKNKIIKKIPGPMIVLLITVPLAAYLNFSATQPDYALVTIGDFWGTVGFNADFSGFATFTFWKYVLIFLFVNSLESLLTVKAVDDLDPFKRKSNYNSDLKAVGAGNGLAALLGGLPMISEVVRSSANVGYGAKTKWANFFHGGFLLIAMLLMIPVIEMIPNAALAAMLIYAGYRLAAPKEFISTYKVGTEQFAIFIITIAVTLLEDLLLGIAAGILLKIIFHLFNGAHFNQLFKANYDIESKEDTLYINIHGAAVFSNLIGFKKVFEKYANKSKIVLNFSDCVLIDHSFMEFIHKMQHDTEINGKSLIAIGMENHQPLSTHPYSARKLKKVTH
mgnify:CR=1 FL=1